MSGAMRAALIRWLALSLACCGAVAVAAPPGERHALPPLAEAQLLRAPPLDAAKARAEDAREAKQGIPLRYALGYQPKRASAAAVGPTTQWERAGDRAVWRLGIDAPGAFALDFGFSAFRLPAGAELWIVGEGKGNRIGPFTDRDNRRYGSFHTPRVLGERATVELSVPWALRERVRLELGSVKRAYRDILDPADLAKSGACNVDVACPEGDEWREEIRSVAQYTFQSSGDGFACTGQLAATTDPSRDATEPVFLTAHHCVSTAAEAQSMVLYWRYESPTCRTPGSNESGTPLSRNSASAATQSGAVVLGTHAGSDFTAVRLAEPVPAAAQAVFSGWDRRTTTTPEGSVTIHHPLGHEKRISFNFDPVERTTSCILGATGDSHWTVDNWEIGTTEGGSSGAGLWDPATHLLIGVLSGGTASCTRMEFDCYGRLDAAWNGGGTAATRMRDWLDRGGTGAETLAGGTGCAAPTVSLSSPAFAGGAAAGERFTVTAEVSGGSGSYTLAWDLDGDGIPERTGDQTSIELSYPARTSTQIGVTVTDASECSATVSRALDVRGPALAASAAAPQQLCGNDDADIDPGERWRIPVTLDNEGDGAFGSGARALFVPATGSGRAPIGPDAYGYTATTSALGGCDYNFVDLREGANAVDPLPLVEVVDTGGLGARDDGRTSDAIDLGGGVQVYGQTVTQAVMSTNGYISFDDGETGADYDNDCSGAADRGSERPRLHVLHADLVLASTGGALRHRRFATCPRPAEVGGAQACHVFQWSGAQLWRSNNELEGNFEFQALLYEDSGEIVYQYRSEDPLQGAEATIGLVAASPQQGLLNVSCNEAGVAAAQSAVCIFDKDAQPVAGEPALRLETPAPALAALAAGGSVTVPVDIAVPADASCGAPLGLQFRGAASATVSAPSAPQSVLSASVGGEGDCQAASCAAEVPEVDARRGLFYNPHRGGNGLLHLVHPGEEGAVYGGVWYTAGADRQPLWYELAGDWADNLATAPIRRYANTGSAEELALESELVGQAWIAQPAPEEVLFAWQFDDGRRGIELFGTSGVPFASPNRTQLWFAPEQPGWGHGVESSALPGGGYNEFWATFLYDAAGDPRWVSGNTGETGGSVPMTAYEVHCPGCPFLVDQLARGRDAGSLDRSWTGTGSGVLDTAIVLPAPLSGSWMRDNLPIVPIALPDQP